MAFRGIETSLSNISRATGIQQKIWHSLTVRSAQPLTVGSLIPVEWPHLVVGTTAGGCVMTECGEPLPQSARTSPISEVQAKMTRHS